MHQVCQPRSADSEGFYKTVTARFASRVGGTQRVREPKKKAPTVYANGESLEGAATGGCALAVGLEAAHRMALQVTFPAICPVVTWSRVQHGRRLCAFA
jgi:hypothetical protein